MQFFSLKELKKLSKLGIIFYGFDGVKIDKNAKIEKGCIVEQFVEILGNSTLKSGCQIKSFSSIINSEIGFKTIVDKSEIENSKVGDECTVGPYAHIKQNSKIGDNVRIGNFVEIKNSQIGFGCKLAHLTYVGDAEVGKNVNFGCGVVFANYDGNKKHKTVVGNDVFIGCNCNLVAPITIGDNCFIAAGTTLTKSLENGTFCIARAVETTKENKFKKQ
ncbi:MAG: UDP-N-acetylglucosamine diphosphorylase [Clostridia bacterium]|nr:UDP-N-acetylglucosamine diphosphorylase [Clostridia bacterium]